VYICCFNVLEHALMQPTWFLQVERNCCQTEFESLKRCFYKEVRPHVIINLFSCTMHQDKVLGYIALNMSALNMSILVHQCLRWTSVPPTALQSHVVGTWWACWMMLTFAHLMLLLSVAAVQS